MIKSQKTGLKSPVQMQIVKSDLYYNLKNNGVTTLFDEARFKNLAKQRYVDLYYCSINIATISPEMFGEFCKAWRKAH